MYQADFETVPAKLGWLAAPPTGDSRGKSNYQPTHNGRKYSHTKNTQHAAVKEGGIADERMQFLDAAFILLNLTLRDF